MKTLGNNLQSTLETRVKVKYIYKIEKKVLLLFYCIMYNQHYRKKLENGPKNFFKQSFRMIHFFPDNL